jgi:hypothetical protein
VVRWRGACAFGLVSRTPGRLRDPPWGYYGPCARSSLTARMTPGHASADRSWAKAERHSPEPQQGAERRAGPRHGPVISGDPEMDPAARRVIGCGVPHQRLSALCSPPFFRERKETRGARPLHSGRRSLGCLTIESGDRASDATRMPRALSPSPGGGGSVSKSEANASRGGVALNFTPPRRSFHSRRPSPSRGG